MCVCSAHMYAYVHVCAVHTHVHVHACVWLDACTERFLCLSNRLSHPSNESGIFLLVVGQKPLAELLQFYLFNFIFQAIRSSE